MPKISVIVPIYKVEPYLERCIDSILGQTFRDFELILVDDGSPDGCPGICDAYAEKDSRVIVIHKENGGLSSARNAGIDWTFEHSDSQYISFVDSDDWVHCQYLETLYNALKTGNTDISKIFMKSFKDGTELEVTDLDAELYVIDNRTACHRIDDGKVGTCYVTAWGKLYRKELWETIRFPEGRLFEDAYTAHHILYSANGIAVVDSPMYYYRLREESISGGCYNVKYMDRIYGYIDRTEFYHEHDEKELYHEAVLFTLKEVCRDYYSCLNEIHNDDAAAECRAIFNKYFDKERKHIRIIDHYNFWKFRYSKYERFWTLVHYCVRAAKSLKVNGLYGSIKKCMNKISKRLLKKTGCSDI